MNDKIKIQNFMPDEVFKVLTSRSDGLTAGEVQERLLQVGKNTFEVLDRWKWVRSLIKQFTNFFTILLNVSAAICFVAHHIQPGESMNVLGWALLGVSLLNAMFSFFQEYRAERAMAALKKFLPPRVIVRRQSQAVKVLADEIVPGDLLIIAEGDLIPADSRLVKCDDIVVNNAPLTGEAKPLALTAGPSTKRLVECENVVFAGCSVIKGSGEAVVFATGLRTEFGKIAHLSQAIKRPPSPLELETGHMVRVLTMIATLMGFSFFLYGVLTDRPLWVNLVFMMGIIVANVPEGLLPTFTLSLAMGSLRMARKNVLVKALNAVEALGAVHVICTDKTGTLTLNKLTITRLVDPLTGCKMEKDHESLTLRLALCASDARRSERGFSGDPLDVAVAQIYTERGEDFEAVVQNTVKHFAFDVEKRRSAGVYYTPEEGFFAIKGAWETIRPMISFISKKDGSTVSADEEHLNRAEAVMHDMASTGLRVIAVAYRPLISSVSDEIQQDVFEQNLILIGFLGIEDPIRNEVPEAVNKCFGAGIDIIIITGDHPETALAIARRSGILTGEKPENTVLTGDILESLTQDQLINKLEQGVRIFARSTPEQKMKIVSALKSMEKVVAMTGDGVNDAPALKNADVGVAMGKEGTDVARESAQIILIDDNFASIVAGIEEGRTVFSNIKKFTNYVLVSNGPEILPYLLYVLLPVPLALTVIQILTIDLGTDIIPSIALGQEPPDAAEMQNPPRDRNKGLLTLPLICHSYLFLGLLEGLWSLSLFFYVLVHGGWQYGQELSSGDPLYQSATGIALSTILLMQIGNLLGRRFPYRSGLDAGVLRNKLMVMGIVVQIVFSWAVLYFPPMQRIMRTGPVAKEIYFLAWFGILLIFGMDYLRKKITARFIKQ
ncbi:MAG: cation-translocating P-type ATPase [Desulfobacterales bacterium]